jgi:citrate lyase subunit beta / citryl-CoA lyase
VISADGIADLADSSGTPRPRRSAIYLPGANPRALEKARGLAADVLIFDLEDSVAPAGKIAARQRVRESLLAGGYAPHECIVRVNGIDSEWCAADLASLKGVPVAGILFPKVGSVADLKSIEGQLEISDIDPRTPLWVMAETAAGILNIHAICQSSSRIRCIVVGTSDLSRDLRAPETPGRLGLLAALSHCVLAGRAAGADVLDGVHIDLDDLSGFEKACVQGRNLGFDGKTLIHPKQIDVANRTFAPRTEELSRAQRIIQAWAQAAGNDSGVLVVDGQLVEHLHVAEAQRTIALQRAIDARHEVQPIE